MKVLMYIFIFEFIPYLFSEYREIIGKVLLFGGLLTTIVIQLYIVILAFKDKFIKGIACFIIPAYIIFYGIHVRKIKALIIWGLGLFMFIAGIGILS